jgi:hypothetical protein
MELFYFNQYIQITIFFFKQKIAKFKMSYETKIVKLAKDIKSSFELLLIEDLKSKLNSYKKDNDCVFDVDDLTKFLTPKLKPKTTKRSYSNNGKYVSSKHKEDVESDGVVVKYCCHKFGSRSTKNPPGHYCNNVAKVECNDLWYCNQHKKKTSKKAKPNVSKPKTETEKKVDKYKAPDFDIDTDTDTDSG